MTEISRRLVISDVHGCLNTLIELVENRINLSKKDTVYLLGDYIDRGPNSAGVVDYILSLLEKGFQIFPLRGNHEENILRAQKEYDLETFAFYVSKINKSSGLLDANKRLKSNYFDFFSNLPFFYEMPDYILVHAGINFAAEKPYSDVDSMLEIRGATYTNRIANNKRIVHGHQVTTLQEICNALKNHAPSIPLDNGCVYTSRHKVYDYQSLGNLCCLNLDTLELIVQPNIDFA
jgi:serine/threonine protein phosphatase 1